MKWLGYISLFLLFVLVGCFIWFIVQVNAKRTLAKPVEVVVEELAGTEGTAQALYDAGVIPSKLAFILQVIFTGQRTALRSGVYLFSGEVNIPLVISIVTKKTSLQNEVEVTLLEGWTVEQMGAALEPALSFSALDYVTLAKAQGVEGYLFPDTYRFFLDATPQDVIDKQVANFHAKFTADMETALAEQGRTLSDAVILASIVEKEARTREDKDLVAGVFWKRLDNGMRLQSDVTVNYITGKTTVSNADAGIESAYNTYRVDGLPPAPISNPGFEALYAVTYPTASDYWYFIATPDGEVLYSTTYEEHLQYKAQYYP